MFSPNFYAKIGNYEVLYDASNDCYIIFLMELHLPPVVRSLQTHLLHCISFELNNLNRKVYICCFICGEKKSFIWTFLSYSYYVFIIFTRRYMIYLVMTNYSFLMIVLISLILC